MEKQSTAFGTDRQRKITSKEWAEVVAGERMDQVQPASYQRMYKRR